MPTHAAVVAVLRPAAAKAPSVSVPNSRRVYICASPDHGPAEAGHYRNDHGPAETDTTGTAQTRTTCRLRQRGRTGARRPYRSAARWRLVRSPSATGVFRSPDRTRRG